MDEVIVFQHVLHEHAGTLSAVLRRQGFRLRTVDVWKKIPPLSRLSRAAGLVVMGGPMSVYESHRYPYLRREMEVIRHFIRKGKPVLGICLGSQLIAGALGARVYPNRVREIGWVAVRSTPEGRRDPVCGEMPTPSRVFQWHQDTFDLPRQAVLLVTGDDCRHQAFRVGKTVYGFQFHPEMDATMIRDWIQSSDGRREISGCPGNSPERILRDTRRSLSGMKRWGRRLFNAFSSTIRGSHPGA
ncbi:MAG TPA: type 1 glutamine amidotransferase [Elusimicrobiota bacterium]|nr:type 1 glutamine amidotransferase [Elusimicrobiota bacterium]